MLMQDLPPHSSVLTPALSSHSSPQPSPPARSPTTTHPVPEPQHDASAELPDDATAEEQIAMEDAAQGAFMPQRVFRNRKAIQVNPYQGERALYEAAMRRGNQKDAVVRRREELDIVRRANGGGAVEADSSLQGWLVDEDVSQEDVRRRKGKGRAVEDDDDSGSEGQAEHKELPRDVIERAFRDAGGLLSDDDSEGDEISKEREAAGLMGPPRKRRLSKGKEKETMVKQVRVKKGKKFPMGLLVGQGVEADQEGEVSRPQQPTLYSVAELTPPSSLLVTVRMTGVALLGTSAPARATLVGHRLRHEDRLQMIDRPRRHLVHWIVAFESRLTTTHPIRSTTEPRPHLLPLVDCPPQQLSLLHQPLNPADSCRVAHLQVLARTRVRPSLTGTQLRETRSRLTPRG